MLNTLLALGISSILYAPPKTVVIDPGHQLTAELTKEPVGPGTKDLKTKVSQGTCGRYSKIPEYQLTLDIALEVEKQLKERGYNVVLTRNTNEVNLSNSQRAQIANDLNADAVVHIHANGVSSSNAHGMMTICQTKDSPYNSDIYKESRLLSDCVLDGAIEATGAKRERVWETNTMTGINWSTVPVTYIEVGYMTNKEEDLLLATKEYQLKIADGIADGIDAYFLGE